MSSWYTANSAHDTLLEPGSANTPQPTATFRLYAAMIEKNPLKNFVALTIVPR
jgi:hypothetical protein